MRVVALLNASYAELVDNCLSIIEGAWYSVAIQPPEEVTWYTVVVLELDEHEMDNVPHFEVRLFDEQGNKLKNSEELIGAAASPAAPGQPVVYRSVLPMKLTFLRACIVKIVVFNGEEQLAETSFAVLAQ